MRRSFVVLFGVLAGCGPEVRSEPVPIDAGVYEKYAADEYPLLHRTWGSAALDGPLQRLREQAAEAVASHPDCDAVMLSEISERSSPPAPAQVFVDCENGNRWRLTLADLARPLPRGENVYNPG